MQRARAASVAGVKRRFVANPWAWCTGAVTAGALVVTGAFGGLERRTDAGRVPVVAVDDVVAAAPWDITVHRAITVASIEGQYLTDDRNRWVGVVATVTVVDDEPNGRLAEALTLSGVPGLVAIGGDGRPTVSRVSDATPAVLNPGIPERVVFLWEQDGTAPAPERLTVEVRRPKYRRDSLTDEARWFYEEATVVAHVPVEVEALAPLTLEPVDD